MTLAEYMIAVDHARQQMILADYIDNAWRRDKERLHWQDVLDHLQHEWLDSPGHCPVMPGTPVLIRHEPNAAKLRSAYPERLDWSQITVWRFEI